MARQRGLVHIEKSSLASALDRARQHVMGVSPLSSFEESSGGSTWHVRKVWKFGSGGGPMELEGIRVAKNMMTTKENIVLPPPMETNNISFAPSNTLSWADRVENSTPSLSPGTSSCPDGGQIPSTPPLWSNNCI
ncbi:hypothetical protein TNCT_120921 [Trichonephila clavata]|uniref:Uncharacterized protein n=1 Tax=Trichonephila clavata TaxID=2740835 RepID=A0A8X6LUA3_TRICU|nr:hypothetical protein TNCT_120921 [Trichonephila clavata]